MARVLIAEDESVLADAVAQGLRRQGHRVSIAYDGAEARAQTENSDFDVVILDRDLPYVSGDTLCREFVSSGLGARIIMVTAAACVSDRVGGLGLGADDYLTKPFSFAELAARVEALTRRPAVRRDPIVEVYDLIIDRGSRRVSRSATQIDLTIKEFDVLVTLAENPECWISAENLLDRVWDENIDPFTSAVKVTISTLRRKLGEPQLIQTLRGVGYRLSNTVGNPE